MKSSIRPIARGFALALVLAAPHVCAQPAPTEAPRAAQPGQGNDAPAAAPAPVGDAAAHGTRSGEDGGAGEADALFQRGVELMKADDCAEAVPQFLKSNALDASAATLLNLGTCYARLGRKATAWKTYQKAASAAQFEKDEVLRERAVQAMTMLAPTLTKVQIVTPKDSPALSLRLNGEVLSNYNGLPIPLDPGQNVIEAIAPGREPWRHNVTADELGATIIVEVPDLPVAPPPAFHPVVAESPSHRTDLRVPAVVVGGVGLAAVLVGSIFGLSAAHSYDDSHAYCAGSNCTQPGIDLRNNASDKAAVATWTVSLGLVATATGVVLWLVSPSNSHSKRASALLSPPPTLGSGYFMVETR